MGADPSEEVSIDRLLEAKAVIPCARWWRLLVVDNHGSPSCISIGWPMKLFALGAEESGLGMRRIKAQQLVSRQEALYRGLEPESTAEPSAEDAMLRRLAFEHNISLGEVQDILQKFRRFDTDGDGDISRAEFSAMVAKCFCISDVSSLPANRCDGLWSGADTDGSGVVDFSEFLSWYKRLEKLGHGASSMRGDPHLVALSGALVSEQRCLRLPRAC